MGETALAHQGRFCYHGHKLPTPAADVRQFLEDVYRAESQQVLATLIRLLGDFGLAEDALHDAFRAALEQWERDGVPANPRAWLVSSDGSRRSTSYAIAEQLASSEEMELRPEVEDDRLRLIFTCCHPALSLERPLAELGR